MNRQRVAVLLLLAVALIAFDLMDDVIGGAAGAVAAIPVLFAAWLLGPRAAVAIALTAAGLAMLLALNGGATLQDVLTVEAVEGLVLGVAGFAIGRLLESRRQTIDRLTETDRATGLLDRTAFLGVLEPKLRIAYPASSDLVAIDIVDFRQMTEMFGDEIGDELLRMIGRRLTDAADGDRRVARIGLHKFAIWLPAGATPAGSAQSVLALLSGPFEIAGTELRLEARVAVARHPNHGRTAAELIRRAEIALDDASMKGEAAAVATAASEQERLSRVETVAALRAAIANGELHLYYQPIVDLPSLATHGVEALVRWDHPVRGLLAPSQFIPLAERSGLIIPLTHWLLAEAVRQSRAWSDEGLAIRISVNIGAKALAESAALPATLAELLRSSAVDPALITLEVTESDVMADVEHSIECLRELKALGVRIEVDDFGTGYSSLAYLQRLPLDGVKIDRSFITSMLVDAGTSAIVRATVDVSHALGLETIAEGVEDPAVIGMLGGMGCDLVQGHAIARPMPAARVVSWIASHAASIRPSAVPAAAPRLGIAHPGSRRSQTASILAS